MGFRVKCMAIICILLVTGVNSSTNSSLLNNDRLGGDLWCYECSESYSRTYDPADSPCRNNLTGVITRQCAKSEIYCRVERLDLYRFDTMLSIARGCTNKCEYGCRFNGLAITYRRCSSCCTTLACNTDSRTNDRSIPPLSQLTLLGCLVLLLLNKM
ncbi:hypothetical protein CAPTEDRAFT_193274 [Capitella teleta]|uniref:UPAR/Ly6 domain-containing protein n=1 Tax=Capitella teleta TaxID=283909 RepID=R7UTY5_CAPTE|nr:hypothetical protein CAPTEDRAFT_193274 [Capitella teleta]|eukprot:ELU09984.1 hypothetical protein CAPTEDRAFT_193274 [Capitella teleta]